MNNLKEDNAIFGAQLDELAKTALIHLWEDHCQGCKNMKCNNSWKEILKCKGAKRKDD